MKGIKFSNNSKHTSRYPDVVPSIFPLNHHKDIKLYQMELAKGNFMFIHPLMIEDYYEFVYIIEGKLQLGNDFYEKFDYFEITTPEEDVILDVLEDTVLLTSIPGIFNGYNSDHLKELAKKMESIQEKDQYTLDHCKRVKVLARKVADRLDVKPKDKIRLIQAAFFHDVGKVLIPDEILKKPSKYSHDEYMKMKDHVILGNEVLEKNYSKEVRQIILEHHERLDGTGYPNGSKDISLLGRILATVDTFDAMTTNRVYKKAKSYQEAIKELKKLTHQYDERVISILEELMNENAI